MKKEGERGSITLFVLVSMMLLLTIVAFSYMGQIDKMNHQKRQIKRIQQEYTVTQEEMKEAYDSIQKGAPPGGTIYIDEEGNKVPIPRGFSVSQTSGENKVKTGLVVKGEEGSEFVWVPVPTPVVNTEQEGNEAKAMAIKVGNNYKGLLYDFTSSGSTVKSGCTTTTTNFREPDMLSYCDSNSTYNNGLFTGDSLQSDYNQMIKSIERYKGFYVGRYEMSFNYTTKQVQSKKGVLSSRIKDTNTYRWYGLYEKAKTYTNDSVTSSMIWGSQYDAMIHWMQRDNNHVLSSIQDGNQNKEQYTGVKETDQLNNIYDLLGGNYEWTQEAYQEKIRIMRGGASNINFNEDIPMRRTTYQPPYNTTTTNIGTRLVLCIQ